MKNSSAERIQNTDSESRFTQNRHQDSWFHPLIILLLNTSQIPTHYKAHPILRYKWNYVNFLITNSLKIHKINDLENTRAKPIFNYENGINEWSIAWWNIVNMKNGGRKRG